MTLNLPKTAIKTYISEWQKNVHFGTAVQLYVTNGYNTNVFCKTKTVCVAVIVRFSSCTIVQK